LNHGGPFGRFHLIERTVTQDKAKCNSARLIQVFECLNKCDKK
jgi:hypothetical protein